MEATVDSLGRVVIPKALRDALGLMPGSKVDISSTHGGALQIVPLRHAARLVEEAGVLVATGETVIDDEVVFSLIGSARG